MEEKMKELIEEIDKLEEQFMSMFSASDLLDMEDDGLKMLKQYFNLMEVSKELMLESAKTTDNMNRQLNDINEKLDMLLRHRD